MIAITFTASIADSVLTVTGTPTGVLAIGQFIYGIGLLPNTSIMSLGTGSGGAGTYYLTKSQTLSSRSMKANSEVNLISDYQNASGSAIVSFYEVDLTPLGGTVFYFTNEKNEKLENPTWQGQVYVAMPIEITGFEYNGRGDFPRPVLKFSNYAAVASGLAKLYNDLVGIKITRKRTRLKYLDAINFVAGNASADPNTYYVDDIYYVNRKINENRMYIEWELSSALDISGIMLPRRQIVQNVCYWAYRSTECSYTGGDAADSNDNIPTHPNYAGSDICGKRLSSCRLRFVTPNPNLLKYSDQFDSTYWSKQYCTITPNVKLAADSSLQTADKVVYDGTIDPFVYTTVETQVNIANRTFTFSIWAWIDSGQPTNASLFIYDDSVTHVFNTTLVLTTTPTRYSLTAAFDGAATGTSVTVRFDGAQTPSVAEYQYIWGAQLEEASGASNYKSTTVAPSYSVLPFGGFPGASKIA